MITGYNTDIKHSNRVFHVQTEDNGRSNPSIVTLIYVGGEILASKKTSYSDVAEISEKKISELMENQHRRMIAAIRKGRFDGPTLPADPLADDDTDVSAAPPMISTMAVARKTGIVEQRPTQGPAAAPPASLSRPPVPAPPPAAASAAPSAPAPPPAAPPPALLSPKTAPPGAPPAGAIPPSQARSGSSATTQPPGAAPPAAAREAAPTIAPPARPTQAGPPKAVSPIPISDRTLDQVIIDYLASESQTEHLELSISSGSDIFCGDQVELRVVARTSLSREPIVGAEVVVRIISTVDKPVAAFKGKTTGDGSCTARFRVPDYSEGNAAIIVTASSPHGNDEVKQLVKRRR